MKKFLKSFLKNSHLSGFILTICIVALLSIFAFKIYESSKLKVVIEENGEIYFFRLGWFKNEKYPIKKINGWWSWEELRYPVYHQIAVPYESKWNDYGWILVLDRHGEIYLRNKERTKRIPLKFVDNVWYRHEDGEWLEQRFEM